MKSVTACSCLLSKLVHVEGFSSWVIFHPGKQVNYVSLQSQCLPRLIRVSQNNRDFSHVIKSIKGFIYDSRDIHCLKRTSCSTGVKFRKSSKSSSLDKRGSSNAMN